MIWYILFYLLLVWFTSNHQYYVIQWHIRLIFSLPNHRLYELNHSCDVVFLKWPQCYNLCSFLRTLTHPICNCTYYLLSEAYELLFLILTTLLLIAGGGGRFENDGNKGGNLWPCYCYLSLWTSLSYTNDILPLYCMLVQVFSRWIYWCFKHMHYQSFSNFVV